MRVLAAVLCVAACSAPPAQKAVTVRLAVPVEWRACPMAAPLPPPPRHLRTIEEIAAWARRVVTAYEHTRAARDACAHSVRELGRIAGG